jgi:ubiquinone/menaquinone biosynthesis C-methylase UbiE
MHEFRRILKPDGKIIVIEPYLFENTPLSNRFMQWYDDGNYIRTEREYIDLFGDHFQCNVVKRFKKCFLYNSPLLQAETQPEFNSVFITLSGIAHADPDYIQRTQDAAAPYETLQETQHSPSAQF